MVASADCRHAANGRVANSSSHAADVGAHRSGGLDAAASDTVQDGKAGDPGSRGNAGGGTAGTSGSGSSGSGSGHEQPADRQLTRCCRGLTYFSQAMLDNGKMPACVGLPTTPDSPPDLSSIPPETVPAGDFKYICMGYSVYEEAQLRDAWQSANGPGAALQVPYCEGVEIVSAADTSPAAAPMLLKEGLDPGTADTLPATAPLLLQESCDPSSPPLTPVAQRAPPEPPRQPRPRFTTPPQAPSGDGIDWAGFPERFGKTAGLIVNRMGSNLNHMATSVKRAWEKAKDDASGGGKRDH